MQAYVFMPINIKAADVISSGSSVSTTLNVGESGILTEEKAKDPPLHQVGPVCGLAQQHEHRLHRMRRQSLFQCLTSRLQCMKEQESLGGYLTITSISFAKGTPKSKRMVPVFVTVRRGEHSNSTPAMLHSVFAQQIDRSEQKLNLSDTLRSAKLDN
jgi:hypothetical protein